MSNWKIFFKKGYLNILFSWSSTSLPGNKGLPALASSVNKISQMMYRYLKFEKNAHKKYYKTLYFSSFLAFCQVEKIKCTLIYHIYPSFARKLHYQAFKYII